MNKLLVTALSLFTFFANAQDLENSLLWKISGNGLSEPSYLYGTVHITCDATLSEKVLAALDATSQLYLELDMDDPSMQSQMVGGMMMKNGTKMSTLATPEDFKLVDEFLTKNVGMSAKLMDNFKPAVVSMMMLPKMLTCPIQSVEQELIKVTKEQEEEVYGLESVAVQMAMFDIIPYEEQMQELINSAKDNMAADKVKYEKMMEIYNSKDLNAIMNFMNEEENNMYGDHNDIMLDNRNISWIPKIEEAAKTTPTFFGVGAAHLPGDNGVIKLLRKKGYKVEAVK